MASLVLVLSCKKDEKTDPFKAGYTDETVEQSKTKVEQNAVDMVDQLDALSSAKGIQVILNLKELETGDPRKSTLENRVFEPLSMISSLGNNNMASEVFDGLKSTGELYKEDPVAVSAVFDSLVGKYTYNFETQEFDKTELADQVIIEFPGLEGDLTNTAVITADHFSVAEISEPFEDWPSELTAELPASLKITLKYNGISLAGFSFNATYKSDGMPTKVNAEIFVDDFTFSMTAIHSPYTSASNKNTLKFKDAILFETYIAAEGDWSEENINDSQEETMHTDEWGDTYYDTETHIEDIINKANAHVILMNLNVIGEVNLKTLGDSLWMLDENIDLMTKEEIAQVQVDAINANAKLIVIYRDSNKKIAEAEAYVASSWDDYDQVMDYYPSMRFIYADGSKVDVETYANNELDSFYASLNDFIDKLNSEYGLEIDHVNGIEVK